jgi:hypothetical protein
MLYEVGISKRLDPKALEKELTLRFSKPWRPDIKSWIDAARGRREDKALELYQKVVKEFRSQKPVIAGRNTQELAERYAKTELVKHFKKPRPEIERWIAAAKKRR